MVIRVRIGKSNIEYLLVTIWLLSNIGFWTQDVKTITVLFINKKNISSDDFHQNHLYHWSVKKKWTFVILPVVTNVVHNHCVNNKFSIPPLFDNGTNTHWAKLVVCINFCLLVVTFDWNIYYCLIIFKLIHVLFI